MAQRFVIERDPLTLLTLLDQIRSASDKEREALGFLPEQAYVEHIFARKVIGLLEVNAKTPQYAGHLLFGGVFPHLRIYQIVITPPFRHLGGAQLMMRALISQAEHEGYLTMLANVAEDLKVANSFYERMGFDVIRTKPGGITRNRSLVVRARELPTNSLLSLMSSSSDAQVGTLAKVRVRAGTPLYAIDLNVLFDLIRERPRSNKADTLFGAALAHELRLVVTSEFSSELKRTSLNREDDPVLALALNLPQLPRQNTDRINVLADQIREIIFPRRQQGAALTPQQQSDVTHLAHAAVAGVAGYITSDEAVLRSRDQLLATLSLDVLALTECAELLTPHSGHVASTKLGDGFKVDVSEDTSPLRSFLASQSVSLEPFVTSEDLRAPRCTLVSDHSGIVGTSILCGGAFDKHFKLVTWVNQLHPLASTIADHLIGDACRHASYNRMARIEMLDITLQSITRRVAKSHGFTNDSSQHSNLHKIAIGRPITAATWKSSVSLLKRLGGLNLQESAPTSRAGGSVSVHILDGSNVQVTLADLETLLSPTLFALSGRVGVLAPISAAYARDLIGTEEQLSFLDVPEAGFLKKRTYFNSPRAARTMQPGSIMVFYESKRRGGRGAAIAAARIIDVTDLAKDAVPESFQRAGVVRNLASLSSSKRILASRFDNLLPFRTPVKLSQLRTLGCVGATNLVTACQITTDQLIAILKEGFECA